MEDQWQASPPEILGYIMAGLRAEEKPIDPWLEIQELARVDPACRNAVDAVRYGRMSVQDAALALALCQTKRAIELQERAVELLRLMPMPPILAPR